MRTWRATKESVRALSVIAALSLLLAPAGCGSSTPVDRQAARGRIKASGSTTLLPIAQEAAVQYTDANKGVRVDVQGGGSSVGITQIGGGIVDVANSSRDLNTEELKYGLVDHKVAFDVIALVVNPKMQVKDLSDAQIKGIYFGNIRNWKQVGGPDKEIVVVVRDQASGTREMFDKKALGASETNVVECTPTAIECSSNGVVREIVASTPNAIGYISFGYIDKRIKSVSFNGVAPTVLNAASRLYPLARYLHMFTKGEAEGVVKGYIDFVLSDRFQAEIVAREYVKIKDVQR
jgi:phosphate transport system substrate-binding protein